MRKAGWVGVTLLVAWMPTGCRFSVRQVSAVKTRWIRHNGDLDAAKTRTPGYAKDAAAVILYDEYLETIDTQGRAVEREREAIRILKPQGRGNSCGVSFDINEKDKLFPRLDHRCRRETLPVPEYGFH